MQQFFSFIILTFVYSSTCFRAFSRPSSGAQWLQWQPLVLPSYRGDSRAVPVVGPAGRPDHRHLWLRWWTFGFHKMRAKFLTNWEPVSFSGRTLLHGVSKDYLANLSKYFFINSRTVRFANSWIYFKPYLGFLTSEAVTFIFLVNGPLNYCGSVTPFASVQGIMTYFWFQTFALFWMLYAFFWVIPRHLNIICRLFGTLCLFHLHRPMKMEQRECLAAGRCNGWAIAAAGNQKHM